MGSLTAGGHTRRAKLEGIRNAFRNGEKDRAAQEFADFFAATGSPSKEDEGMFDMEQRHLDDGQADVGGDL